MLSRSQTWLWPPYGIGQAIIFLPWDFYLLSIFFYLFFPHVISAVGDWMSANACSFADAVHSRSSYKVKVAQWRSFWANCVWYCENDEQLFFCKQIAFISRAIPISAKGSADYEEPWRSIRRMPLTVAFSYSCYLLEFGSEFIRISQWKLDVWSGRDFPNDVFGVMACIVSWDELNSSSRLLQGRRRLYFEHNLPLKSP